MRENDELCISLYDFKALSRSECQPYTSTSRLLIAYSPIVCHIIALAATGNLVSCITVNPRWLTVVSQHGYDSASELLSRLV